MHQNVSNWHGNVALFNFTSTFNFLSLSRFLFWLCFSLSFTLFVSTTFFHFITFFNSLSIYPTPLVILQGKNFTDLFEFQKIHDEMQEKVNSYLETNLVEIDSQSLIKAKSNLTKNVLLIFKAMKVTLGKFETFLWAFATLCEWLQSADL